METLDACPNKGDIGDESARGRERDIEILVAFARKGRRERAVKSNLLATGKQMDAGEGKEEKWLVGWLVVWLAKGVDWRIGAADTDIWRPVAAVGQCYCGRCGSESEDAIN